MYFEIHWDFTSLVEDPKNCVKLFPCWSKSRERALYNVKKKKEKDECHLKFLLNYLRPLQETKNADNNFHSIFNRGCRTPFSEISNS